MPVKLNDKSVLKLNPEAFTKVQGDQLYILTYNSDSVYVLDDIGKDIWSLIHTTKSLGELFQACRENFEEFDKNEMNDVKEFILDLESNGLITIS